MCHYPKKGWTFGYFEMGDIRDNYISGILIGQLVIHSRFLSVANVCHGRLEKRLLLAVYANFPANQSSFLAKVPFPAIFTSLGCSIPWIFQVKFAGWMPLPAPRRVRFAPFVWRNWPRRMRRPGRADQLNQARFPWRNMREVWEVQILRTLLELGWTQHVAGSWDQLKLPRKSLQHDNNATANTSWMILSNAHLASDHDATDSGTNGMRTSQVSLNLGIELLYFHVSRECLSESVWPPQCGSPKLGKLVSTRNCNNYRISGG